MLSNMRAADGSSALAFLLRVWVDNQLSKQKKEEDLCLTFKKRSAFYGSYQTKVTLFALVLLFKLNAPQINAIKVKGPEIAQTGRKTRSKGPIQFSEIPLQQKIFELCVLAFVEKVRDAADANDEEEMDEFSSEEGDFIDEEEYAKENFVLFGNQGTVLSTELRWTRCCAWPTTRKPTGWIRMIQSSRTIQ
jgi:hypothetical protein